VELPLEALDEPVDDPLLWSPETPVLYDLKVTIVKGTEVTDTVVSYTAFRSVGIANGRLLLNGEPYFYRGVLDQGYWPDGILTAPTDDALRFDVETVKRLGFNLARKHVKIEDPRWYYWCDRLGVAVWQDMPSSHNLSRPEARANFTAEWIEVMATTRGYPCLLHWIPINENWGDPGEFPADTFHRSVATDYRCLRLDATRIDRHHRCSRLWQQSASARCRESGQTTRCR